MASITIIKIDLIVFFSTFLQVIPNNVTFVLGRYVKVSDRIERRSDRPQDALYTKIDLSCTFKSTLVVDKILSGNIKFQNCNFIVRAFSNTSPTFRSSARYIYEPLRLKYDSNPEIGDLGLFYLQDNNEGISDEISAITTENELFKIWCPILPYPIAFNEKARDEAQIILSSQLLPFVEHVKKYSTSNLRSRLEMILAGTTSQNLYIACWSIEKRKFFLNNICMDNYKDVINNLSSAHSHTYYFLNEFLTNQAKERWTKSDIRVLSQIATLHRKEKCDQTEIRKYLHSIGSGKWTHVTFPPDKASSTYSMEFDLDYVIKFYHYLYQVDKQFKYPPVIQMAEYLPYISTSSINKIYYPEFKKMCKEFTSESYPEEIRKNANKALNTLK
ncbi:hypothetical protein KIH39_22060 [Telmatocola sphagniphila]|uniref:Uncharacterized protein n=1 Tax=Telmatocola sphagniphila TaxID=1123043 RepID=A0A8E6B6L6_9BACT|nr:hypothetical protein [Telmatocola sphagniphila]QVL31503.1 hypothetical protein KIH39_22060 [Telmatocola sphagniphila]